MNLDDYSEHHKHFYFKPSVPGILEEYLKKHSWTTVLDVGCGDGVMLRSLLELGYLKGKTVFAVDISSQRVERVQRLSKDFRCYVDDACVLRHIQSGSIDVLISSQVIEHVPDDSAMVRQIARVISKGGIAYLSTVSKSPTAWYFYKNNGRTVIDPTHQREYTRDNDLLDLLKSQDMRITESHKSPITRPIVGYTILSRIGAEADITSKSLLLRSIWRFRIPVPGYYEWELIAKKP